MRYAPFVTGTAAIQFFRCRFPLPSSLRDPEDIVLKRSLCLLISFLSFAVAPLARAADAAPTRATLPNGMRVVIIRNTLAPVVTVEANFMVGGDETPDGFPGHGARAGAHGVPRMHGDDGRSDFGDLRAAGRRQQRRHAAEHHAVFRDRACRRSRYCAAGAGRLPARASTIRRRNGTRSAARSSRKWRATCPIPPINSSTG